MTTKRPEGRSVGAARGEFLSRFPHRRNFAEHLPGSPVGGGANFALCPSGSEFGCVNSPRFAVSDLYEAVERPDVLRGTVCEDDSFDYLNHVSHLALKDRFGGHVVLESVAEIAAPPSRDFHLKPPCSRNLDKRKSIRLIKAPA
jgi:hypothetical protein